MLDYGYRFYILWFDSADLVIDRLVWMLDSDLIFYGVVRQRAQEQDISARGSSPQRIKNVSYR